MTKRQRQGAILDLVRRTALSSQKEIARALSRTGITVGQSTVSRDVEELGLVRVRDGQGRLRYALPTEVVPHGEPHLRALAREFLLSVEASGNLVVAKTPPGAANALAEAIDRSKLPGVLGTVAGDDTILLVVTEGASSRAVSRGLRRLGGSP